MSVRGMGEEFGGDKEMRFYLLFVFLHKSQSGPRKNRLKFLHSISTHVEWIE